MIGGWQLDCNCYITPTVIAEVAAITMGVIIFARLLLAAPARKEVIYSTTAYQTNHSSEDYVW